ncbi:LysR family transcriptional regulator [Nocardioides insulae]|uniref:LysR family transcriptional regulator n=1 Tax=Nocardioides insulae TaxID=394734 RepID=UPI000405BAA2|nr:LysR family transcriptional regulator [Nocardioides insulae]
MGIRHLRVVVAVADAGGYTPAARSLHLAQSSLSRTVQEVEHRLGVRVFERTTRRVRLTRDGEELVAVARRVLDEFDAALRHVEGYLQGSRGAVSIAALPSLAAVLLPEVLATFRGERPDVSVQVRDGLSQEVLALVSSGAVDLAVTVTATVPDGLAVQHIAVDRFSCLVPDQHRFVAQDEVHWHELAGEDFVAFDASSSIRAYVDRTLRDLGVELGAVTEARNVGAVAGLASAGLGVTVAPGLVVPMMSFAPLHIRPLVSPVVERDICVIHDPRRPLSRAALALQELLLGAGGLALRPPRDVRWVERAARPGTGRVTPRGVAPGRG